MRRSRRTWSLPLLAAGICAAALVAFAGAGPARVIAAAAVAGLAALALRAVLKLRAENDSVLRRTPEMSTLAFPPSSLGK